MPLAELDLTLFNFAFCLSLSSILIYLQCPSFIKTSVAVNYKVSPTRRPVFVPQLAASMGHSVGYPGQQRGSVQLGKASDLWSRCSSTFMGQT